MEETFEISVRKVKAAYCGHVPLEEMAAILRNAGYVVLSGPDG